MERIFTLLTTFVIIFCLTISANAKLIDRGGGLIYDDVLNITWLQDAHYEATSGDHEDWSMTWYQAKDWVDNLVYADHNEWHLPSISDMDHLYNDPDLDLFINISTDWPDLVFWSDAIFWSSNSTNLGGTGCDDESYPDGCRAYVFGFNDVRDSYAPEYKWYDLYGAWAVHDGDIGHADLLVDSDGDGIIDEWDLCSDTQPEALVDKNGLLSNGLLYPS